MFFRIGNLKTEGLNARLVMSADCGVILKNDGKK